MKITPYFWADGTPADPCTKRVSTCRNREKKITGSGAASNWHGSATPGQRNNTKKSKNREGKRKEKVEVGVRMKRGVSLI